MPQKRAMGHPDLWCSLEHFSCCWALREGSAVAFSLGKTPMKIETLVYTYRRNALAFVAFLQEGQQAVFVEDGYFQFPRFFQF